MILQGGEGGGEYLKPTASSAFDTYGVNMCMGNKKQYGQQYISMLNTIYNNIQSFLAKKGGVDGVRLKVFFGAVLFFTK